MPFVPDAPSPVGPSQGRFVPDAAAPQAAVSFPGSNSFPVAIGEPALNLASGAAGSIAGGLAGIGQGVANLFGGTTGVGDRVRQVQDALTYQPRTDVGQTVSSVVNWPLQQYAKGVDAVRQKVEDVTGSPAAGAVAEVAGNLAPMALPLGKARAATALDDASAAAAKEASLRSLRDATLKEGNAAGYVVPPSATNPTFLGNRLESIGGKAALSQEVQIRNQAVTNKLVREELGIPADRPITTSGLEYIRAKEGRVYDEVRQLPPVPAPSETWFNLPKNLANPSADVDALKKARFESTKQWNFYKRSGDPRALDAANAADTLAEKLDNGLEQAAQAAGRPDLVTKLRDARKKIAQTYDVERALNVDGNVDARTIGAMLDKGKPLTGNLELVGRFAQTFWPFVREESRVPAPGVSKVEALSGAALGVAGGAALGPYGAAAAALPLISSPARALALSKALQGPPTYRPGVLPRAAVAVTRPATAGTLAALLAAQHNRP